LLISVPLGEPLAMRNKLQKLAESPRGAAARSL
jgi:hypothetical protein